MSQYGVELLPLGMACVSLWAIRSLTAAEVVVLVVSIFSPQVKVAGVKDRSPPTPTVAFDKADDDPICMEAEDEGGTTVSPQKNGAFAFELVASLDDVAVEVVFLVIEAILAATGSVANPASLPVVVIAGFVVFHAVGAVAYKRIMLFVVACCCGTVLLLYVLLWIQVAPAILSAASAPIAILPSLAL